MAPEKVLDVELSNEYKLLLLCARTRMKEEIEEEIKSLIHQDIDWDYLLHISAKHRLTPLLYWQLNSVCFDSVPPEVMERLKTYFNENAQKNLLFMGELRKILNIFESHGITAIPYKGPILAIKEYGDLSLRKFSDLDVFIPLEYVLKAKKILMSQGYIPDVQFENAKEKKYIKTQRDLKFFNNNLKIILEIHWTFENLYFSLPSFPKLYDADNTSKIITGNCEFSELSNEDMFLILCLHNANHRWERLSWLCDICEFAKSNDLDWIFIDKKAKSLTIKKIVYINLHLANDLFGLDLPSEIVYDEKNEFKRLIKKIKSHINEFNQLSLIEEAIITFNLREKCSYGIKDVIKGITTPGVLEWKNLSLPIFLYPIYFIYRPYNLIRRYWKK